MDFFNDKRWTGPYRVSSRDGVNYKLISCRGKTLVAHHNLLKLCSAPIGQGLPVHPVSETPGISIGETDSDPQVGIPRNANKGTVRSQTPPVCFVNPVAH